LIEIETNEKHEWLAELKSEYSVMIKQASSDAEKDQLQDEWDTKLEMLKRDLDIKKMLKINELKAKHKEEEDVIKKKVKSEGMVRVR